MLVCAFLVHFAHETAGAARTRHSPLPFGGESSCKPPADRAARTRSQNSLHRRPGLDPGPIRRGPSVRTPALDTFRKITAAAYGSRLKPGRAERLKVESDPSTSLRGALATKQSILSLRGEMDCFARQSRLRATGGSQRRRAYFPHISLATSTASFSLAHCSSSDRMLPSSVEAKPHCGDTASWSSGANLAASSSRRLMSSFFSSSPNFEVMTPTTTILLPFGK